ncbi:lipopolysaccharide biosynthesis protein [Roseomonas marmotae]|uniref:Lipopolysaccharide biosynthesis protein n=1 Tax=Roseomonas marmotae TaxID=2768161 RepID=A0ABS3KEJ0_9PROT|nr:lipopolysaccharide biosynthesis protein [Roseomonas marmotae]MBO1075863.1 lipopolysaccharide biosynthesis protein [Roseomonas marmotae]QTI81947.1 lipopolysaccharide biosynthesis protein [Roseomonas marmotae]
MTASSEGERLATAANIDTITRRLLRNAGTMLGGKAAMGLINLAATGLAFRALGVETFGVLVLMHAFAQAASSITKFQSWQAVLRYGAASLEHGQRAEFRSLVRFTAGLDAGAALGGMAICAAVAWWLGGLFNIAPELAGMAALYATSSAFMVMATPTGLLRLFNRFDVLATRDTLGALVRLAGAGLAFFLGLGLPAFLTVWYIATAVGGLSLVYAAWRELRKRGLIGDAGEGRPPPAARVHPGIWSFVWTTNLTATLSLASGHLGALCAGAVLGPAEAALFAIARQIGEAALKPGRFLSPAIFPELARLAASRDRRAIGALLRRALLASTAGSALLLVVLALLGQPLLRLVGGAEALPAYPVMMLLGIASGIGFASFALEPLLMSIDRQGAALKARLAGAVLYVPAALTGMHLAGLWGAGLASIAMAATMAAIQAGTAMAALRHSNASPFIPPPDNSVGLS